MSTPLVETENSFLVEHHKYICDLARLLKPLMGLTHWKIYIDVDPTLDAQGCCDVNGSYRTARITLNPYQHDTVEDLRSTVIHELIHIVNWPLVRTINVMAQMIPNEQHGVLEEMWRVAEEELTTSVEFMLLEALGTDLDSLSPIPPKMIGFKPPVVHIIEEEAFISTEEEDNAEDQS